MAVQTQLLDALLSKPKINSQDMSKGKQPGQQPAANRTPAFHTHPPTHPHTHTPVPRIFRYFCHMRDIKLQNISERHFFLHEEVLYKNCAISLPDTENSK